MNTVRETLGRRRAEQQDVAEVALTQRVASRAAPPYVRAVAVHETTNRLVTRLGVVGLSLLVGLVAYQQYRIYSLVQEVRTKEFLVIPGAADFVEVRANMIPDRVIVRFVEYFTTQMVSVTERNIERRYDSMAHFMTPDLSVRIDQELTGKVKLLHSLNGAEVFDQLGAPEVDRVTVNGRSIFRAYVRGRVSRYAAGTVLDSTEEVVTVEFRTRSKLGADEPWVFEVTEFIRRTAEEHKKLERARELVGKEQ